VVEEEAGWMERSSLKSRLRSECLGGLRSPFVDVIGPIECAAEIPI
jgi:hypothetical protein